MARLNYLWKVNATKVSISLIIFCSTFYNKLDKTDLNRQYENLVTAAKKFELKLYAHTFQYQPGLLRQSIKGMKGDGRDKQRKRCKVIREGVFLEKRAIILIYELQKQRVIDIDICQLIPGVSNISWDQLWANCGSRSTWDPFALLKFMP